VKIISILKIMRYTMKVQVFLLEELTKESKIIAFCNALIKVRQNGFLSYKIRALHSELLQIY